MTLYKNNEIDLSFSILTFQKWPIPNTSAVCFPEVITHIRILQSNKVANCPSITYPDKFVYRSQKDAQKQTAPRCRLTWK